ncbi:MAG: response regulator [Sedimentisphaerales bacterium]
MNQKKTNYECKTKESRFSFNKVHHFAVLIAEDDDEMRRLLAEALSMDGFEVTECHNGVDFLMELEPFIATKCPVNFDIIISDIRMPGITGLEILEELHERKELPPVILITAFGDSETHAQAKRFGAAAIFDKPFEIDDLLSKVREVALSSLSSEE